MQTCQRLAGARVGAKRELKAGGVVAHHSIAHTCDLVSTSFKHCPLPVFHRQMRLSAVPPPEASKFAWKGHHDSALTAAWCLLMVNLAWLRLDSQMLSTLSLPPEASCVDWGHHLRPQTS